MLRSAIPAIYLTRSPPPKDSGPFPPFPPINITCPAARSKSPPPKDSGCLHPFPPNNTTRPAARSKSPPPEDYVTLSLFPPSNVTRPVARSRSPPPPRKAPKNAADEQWFIQRNGMGQEYYFNTATFDWQIATPDYLRKNTTFADCS